jgi:hypothetical protein
MTFVNMIIRRVSNFAKEDKHIFYFKLNKNIFFESNDETFDFISAIKLKNKQYEEIQNQSNQL